MMLFAGALPPALAESLYIDKERGYFFYERQPEPEPEPAPTPVPTPVVDAPPPEPVEPIAEPPAPVIAEQPEGPPPLSSEWLKANLQSYLFTALDEPTHDNIRAYLYLQRLMLDRSEEFARETQVVLALNPELSADSIRPEFHMASTALNQQATKSAQSILAELSPDLHFTLVTKAGCTLCALQYRTLGIHLKRYGGTLELVSVDGSGIPSEGVPPQPVNPKRLRALSPPSVPALYVRYQDRPETVLTQGVVAVDRLQDLIVRTAAGRGWIDRETYQSTITANSAYLRIPKDEQGNPALPPEVLEQPGLLAEYLRSQLEGETR